MISKLGEDKYVVEMVKKQLKEAFQNKYFKKGYKSAAKGKSRSENPYTLTKECWDILRKRTWFDLGWEQKAYSKTPKQLREIERKNRHVKADKDRKDKHEKEDRKHKHKKVHKSHSH